MTNTQDVSPNPPIQWFIGSRQYWLLQCLGWALYFCVNLAFLVGFASINVEFILGLVNVSIVGMIISHGIRLWMERRGWIENGYARLVTGVFIISAIGAGLWELVSVPINVYLYRDLPSYNPLTLPQLAGFYFQFATVLFAWQGIFLITKLSRKNREVAIDKWRLEAATKEADLLALRAQVNPHFLFNALNSIRALVLEDPHTTRDMITRLAAIFRYTLNENSDGTVPICDEIKITKDYIALEQMRFEKRLEVQWSIDISQQGTAVPSMCLQTLVENAIKHGIANLAEGGRIDVSLLERENQLIVTTSNPGVLSGQSSKSNKMSGYGLENIKQRLALLYGPKALFQLYENSGCVIAEVRIPLEH